jgi:CopG family transcriptional regulator, nickel-responsive regulator
MKEKEKEELTRFGVSFPAPLIEQFDQYILERGYTNRSEAIRDLARRALIEPSSLQADTEVAGTIIMVYDHHVSELPMVLMELQHQYHHDIISTMHVHLNHNQCLEVIIVRGKLSRLRALHQHIQVEKGVFYAELSVTHVEDHGPGTHEHHQEHRHGQGHQHDHR